MAEGIERWPCIPRFSSLMTEQLDGTNTQNEQKRNEILKGLSALQINEDKNATS